jgi:phospholipase/carboxylesterase
VGALSFVHHYQAGSTLDSPTLLLLHGTGGNETDLLPLARELMPGAGMLSPRGKVLEQGRPRFFRRLAEGVLDVEDLRYRTGELADFVGEAATHYGFDATAIAAVGFSNGANIASSLVLLRPGVLQCAVLFRAMVPLVPDPMPSLPRTRVLVSNGRADPLVAEAETARLVQLLEQAGADVTLAWQDAGHNLVQNDLSRAREWLASASAKGER